MYPHGPLDYDDLSQKQMLTMLNRTLVIQSHKTPLPDKWLQLCCDSVRHWAQINSYDYEFIGDELFDCLSQEILDKTATQRVVATDLARLHVLRDRLCTDKDGQGYHQVIWCDADFYIFAPQHFQLIDAPYALGREVWIQYDSQQKLRCYIKVHNAFMMFKNDNVFLDFYIDTATRLVNKNIGSMSPQFIGPKLLTALHNVIQCPVQEDAAMLSPLLIQALAQAPSTPSKALELIQQRSNVTPAAANLCHSLYVRGEVTADQLHACCARLGQVFVHD